MENSNNQIEHCDVSVIVPFYNAEKTIESTINALLNQTLNSIEIVCVNDGSTDSSPMIIEEVSKRTHTPIRLINQENQGVYFARINGIEHANGRYIGFCDADDRPEPTMYSKMYSQAANNKADMVVCAYWRESGDKILSTEMTQEADSVHHVDENSGWLVSVNTAVWNKLIRKNIATQYLTIANPPKITEDALFLLSLYPSIESIQFVSEPLYHYQTDNSQAMKTVSLAEAFDVINAWEELRTRIEIKHYDHIPIIDLAAFIHLGISLPLVMVKSRSAKLGKYLKKTRNALDTEFKTFKQSPFLSWAFVKKHRSWMTLPFCAAIIYHTHLLTPALFLYALLTKVIGKDLKW